MNGPVAGVDASVSIGPHPEGAEQAPFALQTSAWSSPDPPVSDAVQLMVGYPEAEVIVKEPG